MERPAKRQMQDSGLGWGQRSRGESKKYKRHVGERTEIRLCEGQPWELTGKEG